MIRMSTADRIDQIPEELLPKPDYDYLDLMIIEALGKYGPRNLYKVARELEIPESTLRYRINLLKNKRLLFLSTNIYHTNIGLKKGVVFVKSNPQFARYVGEFLGCNEYWIYMKPIHAECEGHYAVYTIPAERAREFEEFLEEIRALDIIWDYKLYWSTCFHRVNPTTTWYDLKDSTWRFKWDSLIRDFENAPTELPLTLRDPRDFPILADETDILILKELEKDATISFAQIAKEHNTTPQCIYYHFKNHIMKNFLIEDFQIAFLKFDPKISVSPVFLFEFPNTTCLAKMANAIRDKPFAEVLGKIIGRDMLLVVAYLPINEFFKMIRTLNKLAEVGCIKRYSYYLQTFLDMTRRETIPHQKFKDGRWEYRHEEHIQKLHELYREVSAKVGA